MNIVEMNSALQIHCQHTIVEFATDNLETDFSDKQALWTAFVRYQVEKLPPGEKAKIL